MKVSAKCPYCNFVNKIEADVNNLDDEIVVCDVDEGGCDSKFVVTYDLSVEVKTWSIVGQEPKNIIKCVVCKTNTVYAEEGDTCDKCLKKS